MSKFAVHVNKTYRSGTVVEETFYTEANTSAEAHQRGGAVAEAEQTRTGVKTECVGVRELPPIGALWAYQPNAPRRGFNSKQHFRGI